MGTYFSVDPAQVQSALGSPGAQTTVPAGTAGSTATQNTVPYATPSTFTNVPLNQLGPYDATGAWGSLDPNSMVTTGAPDGPVVNDQEVIGRIAGYLHQHGYGKPTGNTEEWVIQTLKAHITDQGGNWVLPTRDGGSAPIVGNRSLAALARPPKTLGTVDQPAPFYTDQGIIGGAKQDVGALVESGKEDASAIASLPGLQGGVGDQSHQLKPGTGPHEATSTGPGLSSASLSEPAPTTATKTRNNGDSVLMQDPTTHLWWWASQKGGEWIPDKNQGKPEDRTPPPAPVQADHLGPAKAPLDPALVGLYNHMGLQHNSGMGDWAQVAAAIGVNPRNSPTPTQMKAVDLATFAQSSMTPNQLAQFQEQLWNAGFYDSRSWTQGQFDIATKQAIGGLLKTTADLNATAGKTAGNPANNKYATVWDVLKAETNKITAEGGIESVAATSATKKYTSATESQMDQPTLSAFEARLGRAPTAAELQGVTTMMQDQQKAHAETMPANAYVVPGEGGVSSVPGVTTPTALAAQYAMQNDPNEYEGHSIANAYGLMINALSSKPVGSDPNITNVTRPL